MAVPTGSSRAAGSSGRVEVLETAMLPTALSPTATRVRARSRITPYEDRPRMNPMAIRNRTKAAMAAALASCQPKAWPAVHSRMEAARTDQPRTLTTERTGHT